jgi:hypothetical protein
MNKTSLAITALVVVAATAIGFYGFVATQSAAAQLIAVPSPQNNAFNTDNTATQSATQTGTAAGGAGGPGGFFGNGGNGGSASVDQGICQQAAQSGAFGTSSNSILASDCS